MGEVVPIGVERDEPPRGCTATTKRGDRCRNRAAPGTDRCRVHAGPSRAAKVGPVEMGALEDAVAFLARRARGDYEVDEFGFDRDLTERVLAPLARLFHRSWWRTEWVGMENVPAEGPALVVANHAGTLPFDALVMRFGVLDHHPAHRHVRLLAADLAFRLPFVGPLARKSGNTLACDEDAFRLLDAGEVVGVFPEGYKGVGKLYRDRYRLQRFGRGGFIELALRARVPIVPVAIVGSEEIYPLISRARPLARALGLPYFPITPFFPWLGPLGLIPVPSKWIVEFGQPMATDGYDEDAWQDALFVIDFTDRVRDEIQQMVYRNLMRRPSAFR